MAFFKFRRTGRTPGSTSRDARAGVPAESVEVLRRRARHRLLGASVLVLAAVIGFPLLFDNQPRPVSVDVPITIPDRNKTRPLAAASAPEPVAPAAAPVPVSPPAPAPASVPAAASLDAREEVVPPARLAVPAVPARAKASTPGDPPARKSEEKVVKPSAPGSSAAIKKEVTTAPLPVVPGDDGAKARALLEGREVPKKDALAAERRPTEPAVRIIVQVGAYSDVTKAREARLKLERAGIRTYTQVVETADGKRIRVRVGPFADRADADKAAAKIRKLDLPAALLTL